MSIFTNAASSTAEDGTAYIAAVLNMLGEREPLDVLKELLPEIEKRIAGLSAEQLRHPEAPDKWSIVQVIQHLADAELVWAYRMRLVLAQERPTLTGYDQDLWATRLHYRQAEVKDALEQLRVLRLANLRLLRSLSPADLQRVGIHAERGEESVEYMIRLYAGHDLVHLNQISRIRDKL